MLIVTRGLETKLITGTLIGGRSLPPLSEFEDIAGETVRINGEVENGLIVMMGAKHVPETLSI